MRLLRGAMGDSGARAAVLETVMPETGADVASTSSDMQMLEEVVGLRSLGSILVLRSA